MNVWLYHFKTLDGANLPLERWKGQPLLLVNTASECGFTPQYRKLEALWKEYRPAGLIVLGVPCNDFGAQEPGSNEEIRAFCDSEYGVTFPMTRRQSIVGERPHPLFTAMREEFTADVLPRWNFGKFLFSREGDLVAHWPSKTEPDDPQFRREIERHIGGRP